MFKKIIDYFKKNFFFNSFIIFFGSLIWFLWRTGTKPSRAIYPCQKIARRNIEIFGIPILIFFFHKLRHNPRFRKKIFLGIFTIFIGAYFLRASYFEYKKYASRQTVAQSVSSRVVWATRNGAALDYTNRQYEQKADQNIVNSMMDSAVKAFAGRATVAEAWTQIFRNHNNGADYVQGEKIAIKINNNNGCDDINTRCPMIQTIRALIRQLVNEKGIAQNNITVYDTTRGVVNYQSTGIHRDFPNVLIGGKNNCSGTFGTDLINAKYLINMPLLSTHAMAGVSASFKNHLGSTCSPQNYHGCDSSCVNNSAIVGLNCSDLAGSETPFDKTLLVVGDAIYGIQINGPFGDPQASLGITDPYPNSIFVSQDPVALDSVMIDYIQQRQIEKENRGEYGGIINNGTDPRALLQSAGTACGGNYATSCTSSNCTFNYSNIELIRCDNVDCPNVPGATSTPTLPPAPTSTPTFGPSPTPTSTPTITPTPPPATTFFFDDFDPTKENWTHFADQGTDDFALSTGQFNSPTHAYFSSSTQAVKDDYLITRPIAITIGATLTFYHAFAFESGADGGVLEISTNNGQSWTDLGSSATVGGYNGTINNSTTSPLGEGRALWTGTKSAMTLVSVDLSPYAGQTVLIRFRNTSDSGTTVTGWYIDDVSVSGSSCQNASDVDCSGEVNSLDLTKLISRYGENVPVGTREDVDSSGKVNSLDLTILLSNFGQ